MSERCNLVVSNHSVKIQEGGYCMSCGLRRFGAVALISALVLAGCAKKKPVAVAPQAQAPVVATPAPTPAPQPEAQPAVNVPATSTPAATQTVQPQQKIATKSKSKPHNHAAAKRNPPAPRPADTPTATAKANVPPPNGAPANNGQQEISVSMNEAQVAQQKQITEELLQSTDANLRGINRNLNSDELAMVEQARSYMAQSRAATQDGDLIRANNLAQKAHLLSDALVKH